MYRRFAKKVVVCACAVLLVLCTSLTASALTSGGAELTATKQTLQYYPSGTYITAQSSSMTETDDDQIVFSFLTGSSFSGQVMHELFFNFNSSNTSGDLTIEFMNRSGSTLSDVKYVGLVDMDNWKFLGDGTYDILTDNTGRVKYSGNIPTNISLRLVYDYTSNDLGAYVDIVTKFIFVPENQADKIINNQNENTEEIINNQNDNADKIIESQQQLQENEKQEAENSGNDGVDGVMSALPDLDTNGIQKAIENITTAVSYNSRYCVWTFPSMKIPAISGICDEIVLNEEKEIDLGAWVKKIPDRYITLVRALCSVALILFIIYEFISFIIYCLTLKKGEAGKEDDE